MKSLFILLLLSSVAAMATEAELSAMGQPLTGSFYLEDNNNFVRNPALSGQGGDQISYDVDSKTLMFHDGSLLLGAGSLGYGGSNLLVGLSFLDNFGATVRGTFANGDFFENWGVRVGALFEGVEGYVAIDETPGIVVEEGVEVEDVDTLSLGLVLPFDKFKLFSEYKDDMNSGYYNFLLGLSFMPEMTGATPFADLTYNKDKVTDDGLLLTAGVKVPIKSFVAMAALKQELFFKKKSRLHGGLDYMVSDAFKLGGSIEISPLTKDEIHTADLDVKLSLTYML